MKILVTAATGKVGSEVAKILASQNIPHRLALRDVTKAPKGSEAITFDYFDKNTWKPALQGIDRVYLASLGDQDAQPEKDFVDLAKASGVKRIVKLGAMGIDNTDVPLRQVEKHIEAAGVEWTFVHPTWFYQNYTTGHLETIKRGFFAEPAGDVWTAFIDVRDIAEVSVKALTEEGHVGKIYNLTGSDKLTRTQVAEEISQYLGKKVEYKNVTDEEYRAAAKQYMSAAYIELLSSLYAGVRAGWTQNVSTDAETVLGRKPHGIKEFLSAYGSVYRA